MIAVYIIVGLAIGLLLGYIIGYYRASSNKVAKQDYDSVTNALTEAHTEASILGERLKGSASELKKASDQIDTIEQDRTLLQKSLLDKTKEAASLRTTVEANEATLATLTTERNGLSASVNTLTIENAALKENNKSINERLNSQKTEFEELKKTAQLEFEQLATKILDEKSAKFTETNKANIDALLKPLGENIESFKKKVEDNYNNEAKERHSLGDRVKDLIEQTNKVSLEANNLASALKGQSKFRGDWGEMILESILQNSGLEKDREYVLQHNIKTEEGKNVRPDVLVKLPDNRAVIIDSKVSLVAYDKLCSANTPEEQAIYLSEHMKSVKLHIDSLHDKKYDDLDTSLDFTMMFIPIEPAYIVAIKQDPELWAYAYSKRILLISPTNLIACLKLVSDLWKREFQSKNAMEIVNRGEKLYEKFVGFAASLEDIGKSIAKSQAAYDNAVKLLNSGAGNLVTQAQKLKGLGLKSSKQIPKALLSPNDDELEEDTNDTEANPNDAKKVLGEGNNDLLE